MENGIRKVGRLLAVALVFTLIAAACGGDDESDDTTTAAPNGDVTTTVASNGEVTTTTAMAFDYQPHPVDYGDCVIGTANDDACVATRQWVQDGANQGALDFVRWRRAQFLDRYPSIAQCDAGTYDAGTVLSRVRPDQLPVDLQGSFAEGFVKLDTAEVYQLQIAAEEQLGPLALVEMDQSGSLGLNYVLTPSPGWSFGPGGEPLPNITGPAAAADRNGKVVVLDSDDSSLLTSGAADDGAYSPLTGHATFIRGLIESAGADVELFTIGASSVVEFELAKAAQDAPASEAVMSLSFGTLACEVAGESVVPIALPAMLSSFNDRGAIATVVAAGNEAGSELSYPAALASDAVIDSVIAELGASISNVSLDSPELEDSLNEAITQLQDLRGSVVSVGAVDANGDLADFSNYGPWVTHWERGVDLVSSFPAVDPYHYCSPQVWTGNQLQPSPAGRCWLPEAVITGLGIPEAKGTMTDDMQTAVAHVEITEVPSAGFPRFAVWSGTSFAAPLLAACVAKTGSVTGCGEPAPAFPSGN